MFLFLVVFLLILIITDINRIARYCQCWSQAQIKGESCIRKPLWLPSISKMKRRLKSEYSNTGADTNFNFRTSKLSSCSHVQGVLTTSPDPHFDLLASQVSQVIYVGEQPTWQTAVQSARSNKTIVILQLKEYRYEQYLTGTWLCPPHPHQRPPELAPFARTSMRTCTLMHACSLIRKSSTFDQPPHGAHSVSSLVGGAF